LKERSNLMESINSMHIGGVVRLAKRVLIGTAIIEIIGASLLCIRFCPEFGVAQGIWFSIFHSVSAFCNAGFDLMGAIQPFGSLAPFVSDILVNVVVMVLIIIGGIGFIVWNDIIEHKLHFSHYMLHTKIILSVTGLTILFSTISFMIFEQNAAFANMDFGEQLLAALFCAVTPRTAGFNTIDLGAMSEAGSGLTMMLMLIGAGPGSTAGGIKITTVVVILLSVIAYIRGREDINIFGRRLEDGIIRKSFSSAGLYLFMAFIGGIFILSIEGFSLHETMFEVISAIGTVGLSKGITPYLSIASQIGIIVLMFSGRVGSMSVAMAFVEQKQTAGLRNPAEKIIIG
ncbi:MAG: potassium transporter TrkG, partial [Candidatus Izemoplasmatales bacterium]